MALKVERGTKLVNGWESGGRRFLQEILIAVDSTGIEEGRFSIS
jgi:hypothetical protein